MGNVYQIIGERIRRERELRGWSQARLGELVEYSATAINYYEKGKRKIPLSSLLKISRVLDRPVSYFLDETQDFQPAIGPAGYKNLPPNIRAGILQLIDYVWRDALQGVNEGPLQKRREGLEEEISQLTIFPQDS